MRKLFLEDNCENSIFSKNRLKIRELCYSNQKSKRNLYLNKNPSKSRRGSSKKSISPYLNNHNLQIQREEHDYFSNSHSRSKSKDKILYSKLSYLNPISPQPSIPRRLPSLNQNYSKFTQRSDSDSKINQLTDIHIRPLLNIKIKTESITNTDCNNASVIINQETQTDMHSDEMVSIQKPESLRKFQLKCKYFDGFADISNESVIPELQANHYQRKYLRNNNNLKRKTILSVPPIPEI